jgi:DNA-directed RNA polymerase subunit E'/Rpb7
MTIATGGDSSSTGMSAMISAAFGETFTDRGRSSVGSCVLIHSETPINESSMIKGDIFASYQYTFKAEEKGKGKKAKSKV